MKWTGNLRKMSSELLTPVNYTLNMKNVLEDGPSVPMNELIGRRINIQFENEIHCVVSGKKIKKTFGEGMSFDAWRNSPSAVESILHPEKSRIHEGIALRDFEWEEAHHNQPHYVYLSRTGGIKVGVTRCTNVPFRWIDQGATEAIILAETPYRQLAGLIEVELKEHMSDKTNWRMMLKNEFSDDTDLLDAKEEALELLSEGYYDFISDDDEITKIEFPVLEYPTKVTSMKLDKEELIEGRLMGIKGQYLIFDGGRVMNVRSHAGYRVSINLAE
ncbi:MAG: DUF2797 domain-containing protein [Bacteroidetes bacterium]|nr:DUF2797 domain-containing protein [Bacteroidota bacterium]